MSGRSLPGEESRRAPPGDLQPPATAASLTPAPTGQGGPDDPGRPMSPVEPPPPLEANDGLVTAVITAGWAVALVVLLIVHGDLPPPERWWLWTTVAGFGMGLFGLLYVPYLKHSRARAALRRSRRDRARR